MSSVIDFVLDYVRRIFLVFFSRKHFNGNNTELWMTGCVDGQTDGRVTEKSIEILYFEYSASGK